MSSTPVSTIPPRALFLLLVLTLVWGTNWPLFKYATQEVSVWTFRSIALVFAGCALLFTAKIKGESLKIPPANWHTLCIATFFYLVLWNITSTYAAVLIPSGQAAILGFTMPLWTALITVSILGEKLTPKIVMALALGAVSVGLLMSDGLSAYANAPLGFALGIVSGIGWAVGTIILKRGNINVPVLVLVGWQLLIAAVPLTIGAFLLGDHQWFIPSWRSIAVISYIALVPMCIGNLCWFSIVGILPTNIAGLSSIMVPMVAMVSGAIINQEPLGLNQWLAMLCTCAALALTLFQQASKSSA